MQAPHMNLADPILRGTGTPVRDVLERALEGRELTRADAVVLLGAQGRDLQVLCSIADLARAEATGQEAKPSR